MGGGGVLGSERWCQEGGKGADCTGGEEKYNFQHSLCLNEL